MKDLRQEVDVHLDEQNFKNIENAFPRGAVRGDRYAPEMLKIILQLA